MVFTGFVDLKELLYITFYFVSGITMEPSLSCPLVRFLSQEIKQTFSNSSTASFLPGVEQICFTG